MNRFFKFHLLKPLITTDHMAELRQNAGVKIVLRLLPKKLQESLLGKPDPNFFLYISICEKLCCATSFQ